MKLKTALIAGSALIVLLAVGSALYFRKPAAPAAPPVQAPPPLARKICSPPWSCGRLGRNEPGMKKGVWYLKYDDATGTSQLEIAFTPDAACRVDGVSADCAAMNPRSGSGSSFSGYKDGDLFRVSSLDFTTK